MPARECHDFSTTVMCAYLFSLSKSLLFYPIKHFYSTINKTYSSKKCSLPVLLISELFKILSVFEEISLSPKLGFTIYNDFPLQNK